MKSEIVLKNKRGELLKMVEKRKFYDKNLDYTSRVYVCPYKEEKPKLSARLMQIKSILIEFTKLWARHKELRFGQVIALIQMECESGDLFYVNDNTILYKLMTRNEEERNPK